jgi:hypothetical protein
MRIVALVDDLMDRSRITGSLAAPDRTIEFARDAIGCAGADVVAIDLAHYGASVAAVRLAAPGAWIVGFGPHVDDAVLERGRRDGADAAVARSRFFQDPLGAVTRR